MKVFFFRILISGFCFLVSCSLFAHIALDYPEGSESFFAGNIVNIQWHPVIPHDTQNWDLYISYDGGENYAPLILNIPVSELNFMWDVPYIATDLARIKVVQDNDQDIDYTDYSGDFTIVVPPQDGPVFEMPAQNLTVECDTNTQTLLIEQWLEDNGGAIATGTCGNLTWTNNFTALSDSCGATGSALVTFTVSDNCGINNTTAWLTVIDLAPPAIEMPAADLIVTCDGSGNLIALNAWLNDHGGAAASDVCGDVEWLLDDELIEFSSVCGDAGTTLVTFIASDACGNRSTTSASFTIMDTVAPVIDIPAQDVVFECDGGGNIEDVSQWLESHGGASASDVCSEVTWTNGSSPLMLSCGIAGEGLVTFIASDACGNTSTSLARLTMIDTTPPALLASARDTIIDCKGSDPVPFIEEWLNANGNARAEDVCGDVMWSHDLTTLPVVCDNEFSQMVHFTVTDGCGNTTLTEATVQLAQSTGLYETGPEDVHLMIFPNPADQEVTIMLEKASLQQTLTFYDAMGKPHWHYSGNEDVLIVSLHDFETGMYVLQLMTDSNVYTRTVIVR